MAALTQARRAGRGFGGIPLGHVFGIRIAADWSVLVIFFLVASELGLAALPAWHPDWNPGLTWGVAIGAAIFFFVSILLHELSHSLVAKARGMQVRGITLFIFGGVSQIEGEAPSPKVEFWVAIVGPLTSLVLGAAGLLGGAALSAGHLRQLGGGNTELIVRLLSPGATLLLWLGLMNVLLGVFNLVPGFPLDGGRVLRSLLWWRTGNLEKATRWASQVGQAVAFLLIAWGVVAMFHGNWVGGLWRILIGWFLNNAAKASYQQVLVQGVLSHVSVRQVMRSNLVTVAPDLSVGALVRQHIMQTEQRCFPVAREDELLGIVCLADVRKVPESQWDTMAVGDIMTPASELSMVGPDQTADEALKLLASREVDQVPVIEGHQLLGVLRRQDLVKWLSLHMGAEAPQSVG